MKKQPKAAPSFSLQLSPTQILHLLYSLKNEEGKKKEKRKKKNTSLQLCTLWVETIRLLINFLISDFDINFYWRSSNKNLHKAS